MLSADELYRRAVIAVNDGRHGATLALLDRAMRRGPDPDTAALMIGTRAYVMAERGDPKGAQALCRQAMAIAGIHRRTTAVLAGQLGLVALRGGDLDTAVPMLDLAARGLDHDPHRLGQVLLNRGTLAMQLGHHGPAETDFLRAMTVFGEVGDAVGRAKAQHNAGYLAQLRGDLVPALRAMDAARDVLAPLSAIMAATCDGDRAVLLLAAGMPREAIGLLESASAAAGRAGQRQFQAEFELTLARTLALTDPEAAPAVTRRALRRYRAAGNPNAALSARALLLRSELEKGAGPRQTPLLLDRADELAAQLDHAKNSEGARELRRHAARAAARFGDLPEAVRRLRRLRVRSEESLSARVLHHEVSADVAALAGRHRVALRQAKAGVDLVSAWQLRYEDIDLRTSLALHTRRLLVTGITSALALGDPAQVLTWAELTRGVISRTAPVRQPSHLDLDSHRSDAPRSGLRPLARTSGANWRMHEHEGHGGESAASPRGTELTAIDFGALQRTLASQHAVLVSYLRTDAELAAVVVTPKHITLVRLGAWPPLLPILATLLADLDMSSLSLSQDLTQAVASSLTRDLAAISERVWDPVQTALGGQAPQRLVLTAPPALSGLPWSLLPALAETAVSIPETIADWLRRGDAVGKLGSDAPLVAGFLAGPGLAHARAEIAAGASAWPGAIIVAPEQATTAQLTALAGRTDVLHIAAHGRHSADNPLFSGLEMVDGSWFGYDIEGLEAVPSVVVLSSCELGRSSAVWGQETVGMARAWLHAGVRCVVAAPARVNDATTATALARLHHHLARGLGPADALATMAREGGSPMPFLSFGNGW